MKKTMLFKDMLREIRNTFPRFMSLFLLVALAVAFLSGLRTTEPDMTHTMDVYLDDLNMMDVRILSTLGITDEDVAAAAELDGVCAAQGDWLVDAIVSAGEVSAVAKTISMPADNSGINDPELLEGRLPAAQNECIAEQVLLSSLGVSIGDTVTLDTGTGTYEDALVTDTFTIVGVCHSPLYISKIHGSSSLGTGTLVGALYLPRESYTLDYYTDLYLTLDGAESLNAFGEQYSELIDSFVDSHEDWADQRAELRYKSVYDDAEQALNDAQQKYDDAKADADSELADAEQQLTDARAELDDGWAEYNDGLDSLNTSTADAQAEIDSAEQQLADALAALNDGEAQYADGATALASAREEYDSGLAEYNAGADTLAEKQAEYDAGLAAYNAGVTEYNAQKSAYDAGLAAYNENYAAYQSGLAQWQAAWDAVSAAGAEQSEQGLALQTQKQQLDANAAQLAETKAELDSACIGLDAAAAQLAETEGTLSSAKEALDAGAAVLAESKAQLDAAAEQIAAGQAALSASRSELDDGWAEYNDGLARLQDAKDSLETQTADAQEKLDNAYAELTGGESDYTDGLQDYEDAQTEADQKLSDAQQEIDDGRSDLSDLDACTWYLLTRDENQGTAGFKSDAENMGNLANFFPLIFFLVAALVCLTTMTRMIEDQRITIGDLKALGYSRLDIAGKYLGYGALAAVGGSVLGLLLGNTVIPYIITVCWKILYNHPNVLFDWCPGIYLFSAGMAILIILLTTLLTILNTLRSVPAELMRPRTPKAGKRVFLEMIPPVWKRLSFTWKVTVRNLFRYKRRFWMTVIGIGGCTALLVAGFGLLDSINDILGVQYDELNLYSAYASLTDGENSLSDAESAVSAINSITAYTAVNQSAVDFIGPSGTATGYCVVADTADSLNGFQCFRTRKDHTPVALTDDGVLIAEKLGEMLDIGIGDTLTLDGDTRVDVTVTGIVENYVFNYVYMTQDLYETLYGEPAEHNMLYFTLSDDTDETADAVAAELLDNGSVRSVVNLSESRDNIQQSFGVIDYAVFIIIVSAAALAFVVLFNLSNINITERKRELATLRVLGFRDREMSEYVLRENIFLTLFGSLLGLLMGKYLHLFLVRTIEVQNVMFGRTARPLSYALAVLLTFAFSVAVNFISGEKLKKIDMVESLKSVE